METMLKDAFRWHRQLTASRSGTYPAKTALAALESAREDVANGKARYPVIGDTGKLGAPLATRERWCERPDAIGLRKVGFADECTEWPRRIDHNGWYLEDDYSDELARGIVYRLPARNRKEQFLAGMADPYENGESCLLDTATVYDTKEDAACAADGIAERYAERERDYRRTMAAAHEYAETFETVKSARAELIKVIDAWRATPVNRASKEGQTLRELVREKVCELWNERAEAFSKRRKLESDNSWHESWKDCLLENGVKA